MTESDYQYRQAYERYLATQRRIMSSYSESISLPPSSRPAPLEPNGSSTHPLLHLGIGATPLTPSATDHIIRCGTVNVKEDGLSAWLWKTKWIVLREQTISIHKSEVRVPLSYSQPLTPRASLPFRRLPSSYATSPASSAAISRPTVCCSR